VKKVGIVLGLALVLIVTGLLQRGENKREYTTSSAEAYEHFLRGRDLLDAFKYFEAQEELDHALALDPDFAMAQIYQANLLFRLNRREDAIASTQRADSLASFLANDTERLLIWLNAANWGVAHTDQRDSILTALTAVIPEHLLVLATQAHLAEQEGDVDRVRDIWHKVLEINPNYASAYNSLGYFEANQGRYDDGIAHLKKYAFLAPDLANPHDSLGEVLTYIGRYDEAEQEFVSALKLQPDFFPSLLNLARVHIERGQLKKGQEILEKTRSQFVGTDLEKWIDLTLMQMYYDNRMFNELKPLAARYFTEYPNDRQSGRIRTYFLIYSGRLDEGKAVADSFLSVLRSEPWYNISERFIREIDGLEKSIEAILNELQEKHLQAVENWQEALVLNDFQPPHRLIPTRLRYGESLAKVSHFKGALKQADTILSINPNLIRPLLLQAEANLALGKNNKAHASLAYLDAILVKADPDLPATARADSLKEVLANREQS
jgi:tetratricopeptide (TPR) repeat protein